MLFNPKVIVHHEFEDFTTVAKKYFWRSYFWSRIYRERKKFDPVATTGKEAVTTISAGLLVFFTFLYLCLVVFQSVYRIQEIILYTAYCILIVHLYGVRKFLWFAGKEEGIVFAVKSFFTGIALYIMILAGAAYSFIPAVARGK